MPLSFEDTTRGYRGRHVHQLVQLLVQRRQLQRKRKIGIGISESKNPRLLEGICPWIIRGSKRKSAREKERERNARRWNRIQRNVFDTRRSVYHPFPNVFCQKKILWTFQRKIPRKNINYKFIGYPWLKSYKDKFHASYFSIIILLLSNVD